MLTRRVQLDPSPVAAVARPGPGFGYDLTLASGWNWWRASSGRFVMRGWMLAVGGAVCTITAGAMPRRRLCGLKDI